MRRLCFVLACLALVDVAPAAAVPPPPEVAVLVLSPGAGPGPTDESDDLLAAISPADGGGWLRIVQPAFVNADFDTCAASGVAEEGCVRQVLGARGAAGMTPPTVVVLVGPGPGSSISWTCVGVGEAAFQPDRQRISVDVSGRRAGDRFTALQISEAAGCLTSAAAESGW